MAIAIGSLVVQGTFTGNLDGNMVGDYGQVTGGVAGAFAVLWHDGPFVAAMDEATTLLELDGPLQAGGLLHRRVIPTRSVDPAMAGEVVLQSATDVIIVESPLGKWISTVANVREI
jgi:hypothetical protein